MPDADVIKRSVTRDDYADDPRSGVAYIGLWGGYGVREGVLPPTPPPYWSRQRDALLRSTMYNESYWSGALYIAATKLTAQSWEVGPSDRRNLVTHSHNLLTYADAGRGWVSFLTRNSLDFMTCDNGSFIEIVRASSSKGARITGIIHLDSMRCLRTGDPDIPVIYSDRMGREHEMKAHQVISMADMATGGDMYYGVGLCAASRAYRQIAKLAAIETYAYEKITGSRPQSIYFINGVSDMQLRQAVATSSEDAVRRGAVNFRGAMVVPLLLDKGAVEIAEVPLAALPDGWDRKQELDIALLAYANALGLDVQDLQPISGQQLGAGAQSQVLDDKARGRGQAAYKKQLTHLLNTLVLPGAVSFFFVEDDLRDRQQQAAYDKTRVDTGAAMLKDGLLDQAKVVNWLIDLNVLPPEYAVADDLTPGVSLDDEEKTDSLDDVPPTTDADAMSSVVPPLLESQAAPDVAEKARQRDAKAAVRAALVRAAQRKQESAKMTQ